MPKYLDFIHTTLKQAAKLAINNFGQITHVTTKKHDHNQVLTMTDLEIGHLIISSIQKKFPTHNIIDEEAGLIDQKSQYTWVVDPIDGTSNFAHGLVTYGVMLGLLDNAQPLAGGIILPSLNQIYLAEKNFGAFCNQAKIQVTLEKKLINILLAYGIDGHQEYPEKTFNESKLLSKLILAIRNLRTTNSAYDMVQVPAGRYGAYLNQTTKIWDNVALDILVTEAGGIVTDFWGNKMDYSQPLTKASQNFTIMCSSPVLHEQLQQIIHENK